MYKGKRFMAFTVAIMMVASGVMAATQSESVVYAAKMSRAEAACKAKVDKITSSLKSNYLGLKNVGQWQQYIKEARALAGKLSKSIRVKYVNQIDKAEALVNAAARVNKVEQSMEVNAHTIKNTVTWDMYINLAKTDLAKVDKSIFSKQISELNSRIKTRETIIADIKKVVVSEEVTISGGSYPIHGELVKPKNPLSDMKTVIIVGDAGPTSRDGGTYVNSPYKDIAEGLGSKGIASFRFDKRYYTYGEEFSVEEDLAFTLKEDYVDDYKSIMTYIGSRNDINKDNLYVIGVGQGGNLIPMLEEASGLAKGYVFMGANQSPAEDIIANMSKYLVNVMPGLTDADKAESIGLINTELQLIKGLTEGSADDFFFDQSTKYWLSYKGYNAATKANSISKPMMFLHGGNDLAVPVTEIDKFKSVLSGKDNVIFKTYSGLTSEFIVGAKNFEAYSVKGKVSQAVIDDIAIFVGK